MIKSSIGKSVFVLLMLTMLISCSSKKAEVSENQHSPMISIIDPHNSRPVDMAAVKNKVVLVNFWASWCMPCREEMPSIEALYRKMLSNDKFAMVTILYKDSPEAASDYMKSMGYTFPVFSDINNTSAKNFGVTGVPETYIIDKKGILRKRVIGPADWNSAEANSFINSLIAE